MEKLSSAQLSKPGGRDENQDSGDSVELEDGVRLYLVADGLGGHSGGAVASQVAIDAIIKNAQQYFPFTPEGLNDLKESAQNAIKQRQTEEPELGRMRTTLLLLAISNHQALWIHCGDARLYHFRDHKIQFQTRDHSVPQMLVSSGDMRASEIRHHPDRNRVLRALGGDDNEAKAIVLKSPEQLQPGDAFLLCTDGFWEYVLESEMLHFLKQSKEPQIWLQSMEKLLLSKAEGEFDNYTAMAVMVNSDTTSKSD